MKHEEAKELHVLLVTVIAAFHEKFLLKFRRHNHFCPQVKKNQMKILNILYHYDGLTPTGIGKMLDIEKGSLTTMIDQLEAMDFVIRTVDPDDRRKFLLSLSEAGRQQMDKTMEQYTAGLADLFQDIDPKEMDMFVNSLKYVVDFVKKL
jgi:DNA-binding MarR family transcriptional regulator